MALAVEADALLAQPQFGERWGRHWLDVARFAESSGKEANISFPYAWRYRDYVIDAFNLNIPFDRFTREQLAGDLLPEPSTDQKIATCYNRLLQTSHEGGVQPKEYLAIYAADRIRNFLELNYVALASAAPGVESTKAAVTRVICVRK